MINFRDFLKGNPASIFHVNASKAEAPVLDHVVKMMSRHRHPATKEEIHDIDNRLPDGELTHLTVKMGPHHVSGYGKQTTSRTEVNRNIHEIIPGSNRTFAHHLANDVTYAEDSVNDALHYHGEKPLEFQQAVHMYAPHRVIMHYKSGNNDVVIHHSVMRPSIPDAADDMPGFRYHGWTVHTKDMSGGADEHFYDQQVWQPKLFNGSNRLEEVPNE